MSVAKKIILFLSDLKTGPRASEQAYTGPGGVQVTGTQTNEAPVKYLLQTHPDVGEVLCVTTAVAQPTLPVLREVVRAKAPRVKVTEIPFAEGEDFSAGPLAAIMGRVDQGDEILLELTGGLRDAVMQLLLTSRALSYSGIPTAGAVYANYGAKEVVDCSRLIRFFDLVGGMQELTSFGSVKTLRAYYQGAADPQAQALLDAMEGLHEDITLCRTGKIDQQIARFNAAMRSAQTGAEPLMRALLPAFRKKFGRKLSVPGLIKWCVGSDMIQQALTIYKERIPAYVLNVRGDDLVKAVPRDRLSGRGAEILDAALNGKKDYESEEEVLFRLLLNLGNLLRSQYFDGANQTWQVSPAVLTLEHLDELASRSFHFIVRCDTAKLRAILMDYQYIRILRNMTNHANDESSDSEMLDYLVFQGYPRPEKAGVKEIKHVLSQAMEHLKC